MKTFEIYYKDLTPEAKRRFLEFAGVANAEEGNYDVFPIATVDLEDTNEEQ